MPPLVTSACGIVPLLPGLAVCRGLFLVVDDSSDLGAGIQVLLGAAMVGLGLAAAGIGGPAAAGDNRPFDRPRTPRSWGLHNLDNHRRRGRWACHPPPTTEAVRRSRDDGCAGRASGLRRATRRAAPDGPRAGHRRRSAAEKRKIRYQPVTFDRAGEDTPGRPAKKQRCHLLNDSDGISAYRW